VAGLEKRIADLEAQFAASSEAVASTGERERLLEKFVHRALDAMASIRRAPIDAEPYRYSVEKLRGESPVTVAAHVAALAHLEHEDEAAARAILEEKARERDLSPARHEQLIDLFAVLVRRES
jgi:hypothetical protein